MIRFDEGTHTYYLGSEKLPSVTQIIRPLYDFSAVPADVLRRAADYGTAVHLTVKLYLDCDLDEITLDPALIPPLEGFKRFQDDYPEFAMPHAWETPGYHPKLLYAGTPDLEYESAVIDIKTRPVSLLTDPIQLAAYDHFGPGNRDRYVLELKQDGTYALTHVNKTKKAGADAWSKFRYLLDYHRMGQEINRWRANK